MQNYKVFALFFAFQACFFGHAIIRQYKKNSESSLGVSCGADGATTHNASTNLKHLAKCLYEEADKAGYKGNRCVPATKYWVGNYGIVRDTKCPAVLTENLFQDNKEDVAILMSETGKHAMVDIHVIGAVMGLCVCFCLIYDVCSNGYIKTDLDSLGIFMLRICCFMAGGGINKALAERKKKQPNSEAVNFIGGIYYSLVSNTCHLPVFREPERMIYPFS